MSTLLSNFQLDENTNTVKIIRQFEAEQSLVWDAFTTQEILDQWWAPKPFESKTKVMDFSEGGRRFYAMVSPERQEHYSLQLYTSISPISNFKYTSVFADKDQNPFWPGSEWDFTFSEENDLTTVVITIYNESKERMLQMIEMGFKEGITATLDYLVTWLKDQKNR